MALEASSRLQYRETQLWNRVFLIIRWCIGCSTMGCALAEWVFRDQRLGGDCFEEMPKCKDDRSPRRSIWSIL
jgi:hypothetical protein